jgi:hypothetical protein
MMQLAPRMAPALPATIAQTLTELPFGSQTQVRVGDGNLCAFLAYVAFDRRLGVVKYALRALKPAASCKPSRVSKSYSTAPMPET